MTWQLGIVLLAVAGAVLYLGRTAWRAWTGGKAGCAGGCDCGTKPATHAATPATLIPVEQIKLRKRESQEPRRQ
jgi:hypothetical protein